MTRPAPFLALLAGLVALSAAQAAETPKDKPKPDATLLVGVWRFVKTSGKAPEGIRATTEYTKDGKVVVLMQVKDEKRQAEGTYKLDGDKLTQVMKLRGKETTEVVTVEVLTKEKLTFVGKDKERSEFERVKAEKPEKKPGKK